MSRLRTCADGRLRRRGLSIVEAAISESGAGSIKEIGAVMKLVMPKTKGLADGKQVNAVVRELLSAGE